MHLSHFVIQMGRQKITLAKTFLDFQLNLLLVDVDVVILRNVMDYFAKRVELARTICISNLIASWMWNIFPNTRVSLNPFIISKHEHPETSKPLKGTRRLTF